MIVLEFSTPAPGSVVPTTFTVTGTWSDDGVPDQQGNFIFTLVFLSVRFGSSPPVAAPFDRDARTWFATGSLPPGVHHGEAVTITVEGSGLTDNPSDPDQGGTFATSADLTVVTEIPDAVPPQVTVNAFDNEETVEHPPFRVPLLSGQASDPSGISRVQYSIADGPRLDVDSVTGDPTHVSWAKANLDFNPGRTKVQVFATDTRGNEASETVFVSVLLKAPPTPVELAFDVTTYLSELLGLAGRVLRIGGAATPPTVADVAARLRQPLAGITTPAAHAEAVREVSQARLAVEVLRSQFTTPPPAAVEVNHRFSAYQALLRGIGTDFQELRLARGADAATRTALAARIGVLLSPAKPDHLDDLLLDPATLTEARLETLFGFRSTAPDDLTGAHPTARLLLWQRDALRDQWFDGDRRERDRPANVLPVIDPDLVDGTDFVVRDATNPAWQLWRDRGQAVAAMLTETAAALSGANRTLAGFDAAVAGAARTVDGRSLDITALSAQEAAGADLRTTLVPFGMSLAAFRYLARLRALLAGAALTEDEWRDVASILVQSRKSRLFRQWRLEELSAHVVLAPGTFVVDTELNAADPNDPVHWRRPTETRLEWLRTIHLRAKQATDLDEVFQAGVDSVERRTLPALRDALLTELGTRQTPPETAQQTAERLSRQLCIDLRAAEDTRTSRVIQAVESVQALLIGARSGVFTGAAADRLLAGSEPGFDREFAWLSSYPRWRAVITAFAYPENQLRPSAFVEEKLAPDVFLLAPTRAYVDLVTELARRPTLSPSDATAVTNSPYLRDVRQQAPVPGLPADFVFTDQRTNEQLARYKADCAAILAAAAGTVPAEKDIPQFIREIFWLVPMAVARKLQDSGHYQAALDWYRTVFSFQLPPGQRLIYPGLELESAITSDFGRLPDWLAQPTEVNPHLIARRRRRAYTKHTVMSIVECFLSFGDKEFSRNTPDSNARAQTLYQTAADLLNLDVAIPESGGGDPFPQNPVWRLLSNRASTGLDKIHAGLNIAGQADLDTNKSSTLPSQYRYSVLVDRARSLVTTAQQLEASYLAAIVQGENAAYSEAQAQRDLATAGAMLGVEDLKVDAAAIGVTQAQTQRDRAAFQAGHFGRLIAAGLNSHERDQLFELQVARDLEVGSAALFGIGAFLGLGGKDPASALAGAFGAAGSALGALSGAASLDSQIDGLRASFERREEDWLFQRANAQRDVEIGEQQIAAARTQQQIAIADRGIAGLHLDHAAATAEFLAGKFTNSALFEWMSGVLGGVYAYFLQQAATLAQLAQAQLAFQRQEPSRELIQRDYWQGPPDPATLGDGPDRRGLTAAERLLQDITQLDQYAFDTDRRKLQLTQTLPLSRFAATELQQLRDTGVLTVATPEGLFDADFPGHYLRLVKRIKITVLALTPPVRGLRATLSASGVSRTVVVRDTPETITLRRDPESIAFTAPLNANGLFELEPDDGKLLPFEGMGVDAVWRLEIPKAANPFDFRTIADVLLTIEYTALDSREHRQNVVRTLGVEVSADRSFSIRDEFPDLWYALNNPDTVENPAERMRLTLPLTAEDFTHTLTGLRVTQLTVFVVRDDSLITEVTIPAARHTVDGATTAAGPVVTGGGIAGTRHPGGAPWQAFLGSSPTGAWEFQLQDTPAVRSWFAGEQIKDLVVVFTIAAITPDWP
jgi:hypothetical protein